MGKVDQTIDAICDWIQENLPKADEFDDRNVVGMVKALAELVSARGAGTKTVKFLAPKNLGVSNSKDGGQSDSKAHPI